MPFIYFKLIMIMLVLALIVIIFLGLRTARILPEFRPPRVHLPQLDLRQFLPQPDHAKAEWVDDPEDPAARRARELARDRQFERQNAEPGTFGATFHEEAMQNLEHAFDSLEAGRISADTYRSMVRSVRRVAGRRRAGLAARDEVLGADGNAESSELSQAVAVVEAAEWCLNWIDEYEQLRVSAQSLFRPPELEIRPYS